MTAIAEVGNTVFQHLFDTMGNEGGFSPDAASAGRRALRNSALAYLTYAEQSPVRAAVAFASADNMTDLVQALSVLVHRFPETDEADAALGAFVTRFDDNPLVIDKWLSVQATIPGAGTLDRVKGLMDNRHFVASNPNRVRALVGSFVFANPTGFNRADGEGYRFLAERILAIDPKNPQLAARLLTSLRSWRSLEPFRADHARSALMSIDRSGNLSSDVRDIVDRMLKG